MKKVLTLLGALLLWQSMAVAQNFLHIYRGDSCLAEVPTADLDSATVRDWKFYDNEEAEDTALRFIGTVDDYWGTSYTFDVGVVFGEKGTVYIENLDPFFVQNGFTADKGVNILVGELTVQSDGNSCSINCPTGQAIGYGNCTFVNPFDTSSPIVFTLTADALTCESGYGVYAGATETQEGGYYSAYNPFTLYAPGTTRAAVFARKNTTQQEQLKRLKKLTQNLSAPRRTVRPAVKNAGENTNMQLQPMTTREINEQ